MSETKLSELTPEVLEGRARYFGKKKNTVLVVSGAMAVAMTLGSHYYLQYSKPGMFAKGQELRQEIRAIEHMRRPDVPFGAPKQLDDALETRLIELKAEYSQFKKTPGYTEDVENARDNLDMVSKIHLAGLGLVGLFGAGGAFYYSRKKRPFSVEIEYRERAVVEDKALQEQWLKWKMKKPEPKKPWWEPEKPRGKYDI